jgi:hypothetical protein
MVPGRRARCWWQMIFWYSRRDHHWRQVIFCGGVVVQPWEGAGGIYALAGVGWLIVDKGEIYDLRQTWCQEQIWWEEMVVVQSFVVVMCGVLCHRHPLTKKGQSIWNETGQYWYWSGENAFFPQIFPIGIIRRTEQVYLSSRVKTAGLAMVKSITISLTWT